MRGREREIMAVGKASACSMGYQVHLTSCFFRRHGWADCVVQAFEDDRRKKEAELERSKIALEGERTDLQRARGDLDRFSARVSVLLVGVVCFMGLRFFRDIALRVVVSCSLGGLSHL